MAVVELFGTLVLWAIAFFVLLFEAVVWLFQFVIDAIVKLFYFFIDLVAWIFQTVWVVLLNITHALVSVVAWLFYFFADVVGWIFQTLLSAALWVYSSVLVIVPALKKWGVESGLLAIEELILLCFFSLVLGLVVYILRGCFLWVLKKYNDWQEKGVLERRRVEKTEKYANHLREQKAYLEDKRIMLLNRYVSRHPMMRETRVMQKDYLQCLMFSCMEHGSLSPKEREYFELMAQSSHMDYGTVEALEVFTQESSNEAFESFVDRVVKMDACLKKVLFFEIVVLLIESGVEETAMNAIIFDYAVTFSLKPDSSFRDSFEEYMEDDGFIPDLKCMHSVFLM